MTRHYEAPSSTETHAVSEAHRPAPGKRTYTEAIQRKALVGPVQRKGGTGDVAQPEAIAAEGLTGTSQALPFAGEIQQAFGSHSVAGIEAHVGGPAAAASQQLGAQAYATGSSVAFADTPDLHTAAHEAAHVVQQRSGVHLKDGLGEAGDAHERHADAVADQVVQGRSAEGLLDQYGGEHGGSAVQGKTIQRDTPPDPAAPPAPSPGLEATIRKIEHAYMWVCLKQRDAVSDLYEDSKKSDPPPLWQTLLIAAAEVALSVAMGGVGGAIARALTTKLAAAMAGPASAAVKEVVAASIATAVGDGAKEFGKQVVRRGVTALASSTGSPVEGFWRGLRDGLTDTAKQQQSLFIDQEDALRKAPDGEKQAAALLAAIETNYDNAYGIQRNESLDRWCVYQAQGELGKHAEGKKNEGTALGSQLGDTSAKGVLGLVILVGDPGAPPTILRAEIEGLNAELRRPIAERPIGQMKIPMTVKGEVGPQPSFAEEFFEHKSAAQINVGRNEAGTVWANQHMGRSWLANRGGDRGQLNIGGYNGRTWTTYTDEGVFAGARALIEQDMKDLTVGNKLSG